jgi:transposase
MLLGATVELARSKEIIDKTSKCVAIDSTGYQAWHSSEYYGRRCGLKKSHFPKLSVVLDTRSHLYLSAVASRGPKPDYSEFLPAVHQALKHQRFDTLLADAGYESEAIHVLCREVLGVRSIFPTTRRGRPRKNGRRRNLNGRYRRQLSRRFPRKTYGQRWQIESAFSQDKRRFGSYVNGRDHYSQCRGLLLKVLVHNLAIIWRSIQTFSTEHD